MTGKGHSGLARGKRYGRARKNRRGHGSAGRGEHDNGQRKRTRPRVWSRLRCLPAEVRRLTGIDIAPVGDREVGIQRERRVNPMEIASTAREHCEHSRRTGIRAASTDKTKTRERTTIKEKEREKQGERCGRKASKTTGVADTD